MFFKQITAEGVEFGLSFQALMAILAVILTGLITNKLTIGRKIYALGGNAMQPPVLGLISYFSIYLHTVIWALWQAWQA